MTDPDEEAYCHEIYSPEASDGTFDWPSKIGMTVEVLIGLGIVGALIWWIA